MNTSSLTSSIRPMGPLSKIALSLGLEDLSACSNHIRQLPYGRNANRHDFGLVFSEGKGSCSSKHALLKSIAIEQGMSNVELVLCIFKMKEQNTPGIGSHISDVGLGYIPEAHCYIKIDGEAFDITNERSNIDNIKADILQEENILAHQVTDYKVEHHQNFIKSWIQQKQIHLSFDEVWEAREKCIASLSMNRI